MNGSIEAELKEVLVMARKIIIASRDYKAMLEIAVNEGARITGASRCCLVIKNKRNEFVLKAGYPKEYHGINQKITAEYGADFLEEITEKHKRVMVIINPAEDPRTHYLKEIAKRYNLKAIVFVPFYYKGESLGVMVFDFTNRDFSKLIDVIKKIAGLVGTAMGNIYEEIKSDGNLRQKEKLTLLGENSARMAHVVRNAAVVIGGFANRLNETDWQNPDKAKHEAKIIAEEVRKLELSMSNVLNYSRFLPEKLGFGNHNLNEFTKATAEKFSKFYGQIRFQFKTDRDLMVCFDKEMMGICFDDLIRNAKEAHAKHIWIRTKIKPKIKRFLITVANDGDRIDPTVLDEIFDPFFTTKTAGTGLGLSNVQAIVHAHGGDITAESNEKITIFRIYLPI